MALKFFYELFLCVYISYFLGCVNAAYYYSSIVHDIDIRDYGSGNAGTTNILRVFGIRSALIVFAFDVLKGVVPVLAASKITDNPIILIISACCVIAGHCLPIFIDFRGGKGIASTIGIFLAFNPVATLCLAPFAIVIILTTRYVSLASIVCMTISPAVFYLFNSPPYQIIAAALLAAFTVYQHRSNIKRILNKTESKIF